MEPSARVSRLVDVVVSSPDVSVSVPVTVAAFPSVMPPLPFMVRLLILPENKEEGNVRPMVLVNVRVPASASMVPDVRATVPDMVRVWELRSRMPEVRVRIAETVML